MKTIADQADDQVSTLVSSQNSRGIASERTKIGEPSATVLPKHREHALLLAFERELVVGREGLHLGGF
jgi:hypothetical protein